MACLEKQQYQRLIDRLVSCGATGLAVCYSGGVDSTLVMAAAQQAEIQPLLAITLVTPLHTARKSLWLAKSLSSIPGSSNLSS